MVRVYPKLHWVENFPPKFLLHLMSLYSVAALRNFENSSNMAKIWVEIEKKIYVQLAFNTFSDGVYFGHPENRFSGI